MDLNAILNKEQAEAVQRTEGPLLVLAGAGSGKTRVLTHRIAYLIQEKGVFPSHILAITFTNKAAAEMRERVEKLLPGEGNSVWVSTFHSMCLRILRREIEHLSYGRDFSIYDTDDQRTLMRQILKELKIDSKTLRERAVLSQISQTKNRGGNAENYLSESDGDYLSKLIYQCFKRYEEKLKENNALDFDDLLLKTLALFEQFPEVLLQYQERFRYILVDEYQDTNDVQFRLIYALAKKYRNICVVGDDDQSIYRFRGANLENILSFEAEFPGCHTIKLEQNYRSTSPILHLANTVIQENTRRKAKNSGRKKRRERKSSFRNMRLQRKKQEKLSAISEAKTASIKTSPSSTVRTPSPVSLRSSALHGTFPTRLWGSELLSAKRNQGSPRLYEDYGKPKGRYRLRTNHQCTEARNRKCQHRKTSAVWSSVRRILSYRNNPLC